MSSYTTRISDYVWAAVALAATGVTGRAMLLALVALVRDPSWGGLGNFALTILITGVIGWWIIMGAWRRTRWGAPTGGVRDVRERRQQAQQTAH